MEKKRDSTKGSVLIIVAIAMVVLLGFAALALDGGLLYARHTRLQDVGDSMALAAAQKIAETNGNNENNKKKEGFNAAYDFAGYNMLTTSSKDQTNYKADISYGDDEGEMQVSFPDGINKVVVTLNLNTNLFFAKVMGFDLTNVVTTSTALIGQAANQTGGLIPVGIVSSETNYLEDYVTGTEYALSLAPGAGTSGDYRYLDFGANDMFDEYLQYGYDGTITVGDEIPVYEGESVGLVDHSIEDRLGTDNCTLDANGNGVVDPDERDSIDPDTGIIHDSCPRMVYTPVIENTDEDPKIVIGFAKFFITEYTGSPDMVLKGIFISDAEPSEIAPSTLSIATQTVRLIDN